MSFQASDYKGRQFLELLNSDLNPLEPSTKNGGLWLCYMQVYLSRNHIPVVISSPNYTSPSSKVEIFLFNLVFHDGVTVITQNP